MMDRLDATKPPAWYWLVAVLALLWEGAGCFAYVSQVGMSADALAQLPAAQREIWMMMPVWVTGAYAIAVWAGLAGAVALIVRRRWAQPLFLVSLAAAIVQFGWTFLATPIMRTVGAAAAVPFPIFIILVAALLAWFSGRAAGRGWLR
ncbi:hypothetical protein G432_08955 [Sphingomonas sp. MM-1]|uniref:hypothetical protein n=1 Tax=Sphingomonas sp. MM-1 TaxID=745310 RepID=UPI0002C05B63|nr:hypothetical protein [Sphingomonas sp. MM-1]AGH49516.1 hypothetical protein G432_08955 [Sphingomonas sp. MM-1]